ncbi:MAG: hypothetical protein JWP81_870 [Ferruginibacter sp.]|nr:hypothetical protein [Ferruginibacter sp.]
MNHTINCRWIFLVLLLIAKCSNAQDHNTYQAADAVVLQVNENTRVENRLKGAILTLPNNSTQLNLRLRIPSHLINYNPADNAGVSSPGFSFNLKINIDPHEIQEYLTSAKTFVTHGLLTLNGTTKQVMVEYMPLPNGTELDGDFNLSMNIRFSPGDFNLDDQHTNSLFIIMINDTPVNRI